MQKTFEIEQAYFFKAPPKKVFQALTDSRVLTKWFLSKANVVPKRGGTYAFDWIGGYHMTGEVKEIEANKSVSYSWHDRLESGEVTNTIASFEVVRKGNGTLLKLHHTGFEDPVHFAECSSRWGYYLTNMKSVLEHGKDLRSKYDW